jgi:ABC-type multidrug transport system ATPase subunit
LETLTVREHLTFACLLRQPTNVLKEEKLNFVEQILNLLSLSHIQDSQIKILSGGEQKRCSIGAELLASPRFLLLDEPLSGLDSAVASQLLTSLKHLANGISIAVREEGMDANVEMGSLLPQMGILM